MRDVTKEGAGDDGLIQRFGLLVWPDQVCDWRNVDREPNAAFAENAGRVFETLDGLSHDGFPSAVSRTHDGVPVFRFASDAQERFRAWHLELETRLRSETISPALESHIAKYRKLVPALSVLWHVADGQMSAVSLSVLEKAISLAQALETHAMRAYGASKREEMEVARRLLKRIGEGCLPAEFTARDVYRKQWSGLRSPSEAEGACSILVENGWLTPQEDPHNSSGGRPSLRYIAHPLALAPGNIEGH